jgi:hypothetical protein
MGWRAREEAAAMHAVKQSARCRWALILAFTSPVTPLRVKGREAKRKLNCAEQAEQRSASSGRDSAQTAPHGEGRAR